MINFSMSHSGNDPDNEYNYTERRCGLFNGYRTNCEDLVEHHGWESCDSCTSNLCNGAVNERRPILTIVLIFGIIMLIYMWNFDTTPFRD